MSNSLRAGYEYEAESRTTLKGKRAMNYRISIDGCDASTVFDMDLTETEVATIQRMAAMSKETSTYSCMPTISVEEVTPDNIFLGN